MNYKEKQQIFTLKKLEPANVLHFCLKMKQFINYQNSCHLIFVQSTNHCRSTYSLCKNNPSVLINFTLLQCLPCHLVTFSVLSAGQLWKTRPVISTVVSAATQCPYN